MRDLYIFRTGRPILLKGNMWTDPGNIEIAQRHMNVEIGTEAAQFPEKEYMNEIFVAVCTKCLYLLLQRLVVFSDLLFFSKVQYVFAGIMRPLSPYLLILNGRITVLLVLACCRTLFPFLARVFKYFYSAVGPYSLPSVRVFPAFCGALLRFLSGSITVL
jgi:hypothetical protein